jgi:hypothetical protein
MKLALVVPDGPGIRNFVLGRFLERAARIGEVLVLHPIPADRVERYGALAHAGVEPVALKPFTDRASSFVLRNTLAYAHMYWADTGAMRYNRSVRITGSRKTRVATRVSRAAGRIVASVGGMRALDKWHMAAIARTPEAAYYRRLFARTRPSIVFSSNQRAPIVAPVVAAAQSLGIPTATFIFSWDNVTSKGRIIAPFDHYFVWSPLMRDELLAFYPALDPAQISVVGTPQFDPYADRTIAWSRQEFFRRIGADASRKLICYSGGDPSVYTAEHEYVTLLMRQIRSGQVRGNPQVALRPSPADEGRQFEAARREFPELLFLPPAWEHTNPGDWTRIVPSPEDVAILTNLTRHADVNINLNSTMTLDFAIHDRPVVNLGFDLRTPPPFGQPLWDFFWQFEHYRPVVDLGAARCARTPDELADALNAYLDDPSLDRQGRRRFVELEVGLPVGESSDCILAVLSTLAGPPQSIERHHERVAV